MIPATWKGTPSQREISNSRAYYPAVGLLLGIMLVGLERGCREVFPDFLSAAVLVIALLVATRGLHLDGLMDTCDGLFGGFTKERRLEIMRDSQVGAFGVAGGASVLLLQYGALGSLLGLGEPGQKWALLLFPMLSRWSMVVALGVFPYVRQQGLGSPFHQGGIGWPTAAAAASAVLAAVLMGGIAGAGMLGRSDGYSLAAGLGHGFQAGRSNWGYLRRGQRGDRRAGVAGGGGCPAPRLAGDFAAGAGLNLCGPARTTWRFWPWRWLWTWSLGNRRPGFTQRSGWGAL